MLTLPGDVEPTCGGCHNKPDSCTCTGPDSDTSDTAQESPVSNDDRDAFAALDGKPDGAETLALVHATLTRYVVFPSPEAADAVTLYAAATHAMPELEFAARLVIKSPVKRCGKSRLLDVLGQLVHQPLITSDISAAALVRSVSEDDPPTIMLDEADAIFGKALKGDEKAEHLRGILNAGFGRDRPYTRWDITTRGVEDCPTFAMAVLAGIGSMPDTIEDRAVVITMRRKAPGEAARPSTASAVTRRRSRRWAIGSPHGSGPGRRSWPTPSRTCPQVSTTGPRMSGRR